MSRQISIDLDEAFGQVKDLVRRTPLSESEREKQYTNIQAFKKVKEEWQQLRAEVQELRKKKKKLEQQLKGRDNG